jgi:hypothetical protein
MVVNVSLSVYQGIPSSSPNSIISSVLPVFNYVLEEASVKLLANERNINPVCYFNEVLVAVLVS